MFALKLPNKKAEKPIDWLGVVFLSAATTCIVFFADFGGSAEQGWDSWATWAWGAGLILSAGLFVLTESRAADPIMPLSMFRNPIFVNATAIGMAIGIGMFAALGFVPTFLQMSSGTSAAASGLLMLPMMVGVMGTAITSGLLITKTGRYKIFPIARHAHRRHRHDPHDDAHRVDPDLADLRVHVPVRRRPRLHHAGRRADRAERGSGVRDRNRDVDEQLLP